MSDDEITTTDHEITRLLRLWSEGDPDALDTVLTMVFDEVRNLARKQFAGESPDHTLQPTALVNEAYLRLINRKTYWWKDRRDFFSALARLMRQILVDHARRKKADKRGGKNVKIPLEEGLPAFHRRPDWVLALDDPLEELKEIDERRYKIVMLKVFVGLTQEEIAEELGVSINTVQRHWRGAIRWLQHEMKKPDEDEEEDEEDETQESDDSVEDEEEDEDEETA